MTDVRLKISPPWVTYINKLEAMFDGDPQIACNVDCSAANPSIVLAVNNPDKAAALLKLLPETVTFGNINLSVGIDGTNGISNRAFPTAKELFETAFKGNPAFAYVVVPEGVWYVPFTYVVFKNCVVQFFNDNLNDPHGLISTLYQDIAEELFAGVKYAGQICYCTDIEQKLGMPLGEWP